jgi:hypothetical protein
MSYFYLFQNFYLCSQSFLENAPRIVSRNILVNRRYDRFKTFTLSSSVFFKSSLIKASNSFCCSDSLQKRLIPYFLYQHPVKAVRLTPHYFASIFKFLIPVNDCFPGLTCLLSLVITSISFINDSKTIPIIK